MEIVEPRMDRKRAVWQRYFCQGLFDRQRLGSFVLPLAVGSFIILSSFVYGLVRGLDKRQAHALAPSTALGSSTQDFQSGDSSSESNLKLITPPEGVSFVPLGSEVTINNHPAELISFVSERAPRELCEQQAASWRERGLTVISRITDRRGVVFARSQLSAERYSFTAWSVPVKFRAVLGLDKPTQGMISVVDSSSTAAVSSNEAAGTVPDVPLMAEGKPGAVVRSIDRGKQTFSGVYTIPRDLTEVFDYYRARMAENGWEETFSDLANERAVEFGSVVVTRQGEEITLLLSAKGSEKGGLSDSQEQPATVVAITRGPVVRGPAVWGEETR